MLFPVQSPQEENKPPSPVLIGSAIVLVIGLLVIMPAFVTFTAVVMSPTLVLAMRGSRGDILSLQTMAACNLAGALPYMIKLVQKGDTFSVAMNLMFQLQTIFVVGAGALAGGLLLWLGPVIAARVMTFANQREADNLLAQNAELLTTWSEDLVEDAERMRMGRYQD